MSNVVKLKADRDPGGFGGIDEDDDNLPVEEKLEKGIKRDPLSLSNYPSKDRDGTRAYVSYGKQKAVGFPESWMPFLLKLIEDDRTPFRNIQDLHRDCLRHRPWELGELLGYEGDENFEEYRKLARAEQAIWKQIHQARTLRTEMNEVIAYLMVGSLAAATERIAAMRVADLPPALADWRTRFVQSAEMAVQGGDKPSVPYQLNDHIEALEEMK